MSKIFSRSIRKGQVYHIGWPFLAALAEIEKSTPDALSQLNEDQMRQGAGVPFLFGLVGTSPIGIDESGIARPEVVADMLETVRHFRASSP